MKNYHWLTKLAACAILAIMFFLMLGSIKDDVPIVDEVPHIGAGYSYLVKHDYRLNPEHPPLIKDLAAVPLLFLNLKQPFETQAWSDGVRNAGQWNLGRNLLFELGNDPQKIMFWARLPVMILTIILGFLIFKWSRELFGELTALIVLILYAFSPTVLAHGRFVTTDLGAAIGIFAATYYFYRFLRKPSAKNIFWTGIVFGLAQLTKFSAFLLVPFFIAMSVVWIIVQLRRRPAAGPAAGYSAKIIGGLVLIGLIGYLLVVWPVYQFHVQNYPPERQLEEATYLLGSYGNRALADFDLWLVSKPAFRALGQYGLGLLMVNQRATGGNTTYFLGEVSAAAWRYYFPVVYFLKETLALHILTLAALIYCAFKICRWFRQNRGRHLDSSIANLHNHFAEFLMLVFVLFYWIYSIGSNLNIGVRHVLPTFPFIFILVVSQIVKLIKAGRPKEMAGAFDSLPRQRYNTRVLIKAAPLAILIIWAVFSVTKNYPYFLAYFNESIGGSANGYKYVTDSNLDWGQDLKRLAMFVENPPAGGGAIEKIKLDYFGWSDAAYYLKNRVEPVRREDSEQKGWLAVSTTFLQTSCPNNESHCHNFERSYHWLDQYEPVAKIGYSIFVYDLK